MPSVRMLTNYTIAGKTYSAGDFVNVDSTTLNQLVSAKIADNDADALIRADSENEFVQYVSSNATKTAVPRVDQTKFKSLMEKLKERVNRPNLLETSAIVNGPTVTIGGDNTGSTISNSVFYALNNPLIYVSCGVKVDYATQGRDVFKSIDEAMPWGGVISIVTDAPEIEFDFQVQPTKDFQLVVDGQRASDETYSITISEGNIRKIAKISFGFRKIRKISLISATFNIAGIFINKAYRLYPYPAPDIKMINFIDSYGGAGYYGWFGHSAAQDLMAAIGIEGCSSSHYGGTGYLVENGNRNFYRRLLLNSELFDYDVILTTGGLNDDLNTNTFDAIDNYYKKCYELFPNALLISTGVWCPSASEVVSQPKYKAITNKIRSSLSTFGSQYIFLNTLNGSIETSWGNVFDGNVFNLTSTGSVDDVNNNPLALFTGSGNVIDGGSIGVSPTPGTADGNASVYINTDGVHPTLGYASENYGLDSGKCYVSKWIYEKVKLAINKYPL